MVRYDASNKPPNFRIKEFSKHVTYKPFCPEVAIGLPIPGPIIRQIKKMMLYTYHDLMVVVM